MCLYSFVRNSALFCCLSFVFAITVASCNKSYRGFSKAEEGIYFRLLEIGDLDKCCQFGDYVTVNIAYSTMDDSVFFTGIRTFQVRQPDFSGSIDKCLTLMCRHDSTQFIISAVDFFEKTLATDVPNFLRTEGMMKIYVKLIDIQTPSEFEAFLHWIEDLGEYEKTLLRQYIQNENIEAPATEDGMYIIEQQPGDGPLVAVGDTITIHYEGFFLNGTFFDSTRLRNDPLQFVYGQQWQVIPGLEKALGSMRNRSKALVIMPSDMAFGTDGSVLGIVPPFTSVVFELELINVKN